MTQDSEAGWYYLHTGGDLIWKGAAYTSEADLRESDFVVAYWPFRQGDRELAWTTLVEALAAGANERAVAELADRWRCDNADAVEYAARINVTLARADGDWIAVPPGRVAEAERLTDASIGRGDSCLAALASLARAVGWQPSKTGRPSFPAVLHRQPVTS